MIEAPEMGLLRLLPFSLNLLTETQMITLFVIKSYFWGHAKKP
jgi:hypothetical protein